MPEAIKCGMPVKEFWYGDTRLLKAYQLAYYRSISYNAWLHGQYTHLAYGLVLADAFSKNGSKHEYPKWKDPMEKYEKPKQNRYGNNADHNSQAAWFAEILQRK